MSVKPAYVSLAVYRDRKKIGAAVISYPGPAAFCRDFMKFAKTYIKTAKVSYRTTSSPLLGRGFILSGENVKIDGWYLDYFKRRI